MVIALELTLQAVISIGSCLDANTPLNNSAGYNALTQTLLAQESSRRCSAMAANTTGLLNSSWLKLRSATQRNTAVGYVL
jgi:hypothetical protein